jgi:hypothetical protein
MVGVGDWEAKVERGDYQMKEKGSDKGDIACALGAIVRDDDDEPWPRGGSQNRPILPPSLPSLPIIQQSMILIIHNLIRSGHLCARDSLCPFEYRAPSALLRPSRHALRSRSAWVGEAFVHFSCMHNAWSASGLARSFQPAGNLLVSSIE